MKTLILHGWGGSDFPHWQSYLAGEIARDYGTVSFPLLKEEDAPIKDVWMAQVIEILEDFKPDVVVCHSLANALWFHLCNEHKAYQVKKLFLVAPPSLTCKLSELSTFFPVNFPSNLYAKNVTLITSTNDQYMNKEEAQNLGLHVEEHIVLENAGHINALSGFGEWNEIVEMVKNSF